jgi:hypothetical protein
MRFFESGEEMPEEEEPQYSTCFSQRTARFIVFELTMRNLLYGQESEIYALTMHYYNPDGSLLWELQQYRFIKFDNEWPCHADGCGVEQPGLWDAGDYRVEILIDGITFAEGSFTIE